MLDFDHIDEYRENNRIEAKTALGGLPESIWETYSAFANTFGGYILLGVIEKKDKSLDTVDLPDPERLIRNFRSLLTDRKKVSADIISAKDVYVQKVNGNSIVVIYVPRADRTVRPVYIDGNPLNAYKRNGEGDYRCTKNEYDAMLRDASARTQDMKIMAGCDISALDPETVRAYRSRMKKFRPEHIWNDLGDTEFLVRAGAAVTDGKGTARPTAAGLLMFGTTEEIKREYPHFSLLYRDEENKPLCGKNVFGFFTDVCSNTELSLDLSEKAGRAVREALANCLINSDYYGEAGVSVNVFADRIDITNPGGFRIASSAAAAGGVTDSRNGVIHRIFALIDIGQRIGSGIPFILRTWKEEGLNSPFFTEKGDPDRVILTLPLLSDPDGMTASNRIAAGKRAKNKINESIILFLTDKPETCAAEIAEYTFLSVSSVRKRMKELEKNGIIEISNNGKKNIYRLRR